MITDILVLYWAFSVLFMVGYNSTEKQTIFVKVLAYFLILVTAPVMFPISIGYYFSKNS